MRVFDIFFRSIGSTSAFCAYVFRPFAIKVGRTPLPHKRCSSFSLASSRDKPCLYATVRQCDPELILHSPN